MKDNHTPEFMKDASPLRKVMKQILNASYQGHKEGCLYCAEVNELADHARPDECAESDLLGECLRLCNEAEKVLIFMDGFMDENTELPELIEKLKGVRAKAILAKRKGEL